MIVPGEGAGEFVTSLKISFLIKIYYKISIKNICLFFSVFVCVVAVVCDFFVFRNKWKILCFSGNFPESWSFDSLYHICIKISTYFNEKRRKRKRKNHWMNYFLIFGMISKFKENNSIDDFSIPIKEKEEMMCDG